MKQLEVYERISIILNLAQKRGGFSWEEISRKLENFYQMKGELKMITKRTFQRDLQEIRDLHGVDIQYNKRLQKYQIDEKESSPYKMELLASFDLINAFHLPRSLGGFVSFDERKAKGTEYLFGLVYAIQNGFFVKISFQAFTQTEPSDHWLEPLVLKEFKNRWYLIGKSEDGQIQRFAFDRILEVEISKVKKKGKGTDFDLREYYNGVFGISNELDQPVEEVELIIGKLKAQYIKSMPFHSSQVVVSEREEGVRVRLQVKINYDFVSEILSHGDEIIVVRPVKLKDAVLERAKNIVRGYLRHE
ncbi:helix-turn-helix transcriptional regulator [Algoriphagus boritolerans]|uniref:Predicted DNA-binding transcriptional regulator YafY, contains an HTH and WYL domains n=1 Tax=Algoriphagus boritolerans DSM 17298 = JCM 18970 TaxID=1120964 RepID=A0A1H5ZDQ3_9BACT|nr:WYL domain-containing protein [Algoriphagus boritolerans]SEG34190.1 Predicted DNA-binding transcriptional regulator YafY, contains an HTH and WYL domains [Algoriphagus boritolerans DSM 17298 = JCM 18970]